VAAQKYAQKYKDKMNTKGDIIRHTLQNIQLKH